MIRERETEVNFKIGQLTKCNKITNLPILLNI